MNKTILVNKVHKITQEFIDSLTFVSAKDVQGAEIQVEAETYDAFLRLKDDCLQNDGIEIGIASAFRTIAFQENVYQEFVKKYGKSYADATVAEPAASEHHTGMALDIIPKVDGVFSLDNHALMTYGAFYEPIYKRMYHHGFILRYGQDKEAITGYPYEPWHIRYVGREAAEDIHRKGIALEEYF